MSLEDIRRHFRRETSKLTNWAWVPLRITDYLVQDPDFYDELKELNQRRRAGEISADEWHRLTGEFLRKHQRRDV